MASIVFTSASGSPGATTLAIGCALEWPRPCVLVEADPSGGASITAGRFQGFIPGEGKSILDLVRFSAREQGLAAAFTMVQVPLTQAAPSPLFVPGVVHHTQGASLGNLWQPLLRCCEGLDAAGYDVIFDIGRLGMENTPMYLVESCDLFVAVTSNSLPSVKAAHGHLDGIKKRRDPGDGVPNTGVVVVKSRNDYPSKNVARVLAVALLGTVPFDSESAAVLSHNDAPRKRIIAKPFSRAVKTLATDLSTHSARLRAAMLATEEVPS